MTSHKRHKDFNRLYYQVMDPTLILSVDWFLALSKHRIIEVAHIILMTILVRDDIRHQVKDSTFLIRHPIASLVATFLTIYAGGIIAQILLGQFALVASLDVYNMATLFTVWFLLNFFPKDLLYQLNTWRPILIVWNVLKEVQRCRRVYDGVLLVRSLHPQGFLAMFVVGLLRGAGAAYVRPFIRLIYGVWIPVPNEFVSPSLATKLTAFCAGTFTFMQMISFEMASPEVCFVTVGLVMIALRLMCIFEGVNDPFQPMESCGLHLLSMISGSISSTAAPSTSTTGASQTPEKSSPSEKTKKQKKS